jgi:GNAT superfamily N-acetyltransferase
MAELIVRWQRGWCVARSLPAGEDVGGGLRVHCRQRGRDVEYVAFDEAEVGRLAKLVLAEESVAWLTVASAEPDRAAAALEAAGLTLLKRSEKLMVVDLREHPVGAVPAPYRLETRIEGGLVAVEVLDDSGAVGASGNAGLSGSDAVADKITTDPAHRRRGLGRAVMGALAGTALEYGAETGVLIASEDGQRLYPALGWRTVADVLIAARPGTVYPD